MKKLFCILVALFMVAAALPVFATPTSAGDLATEYFAIPYKDGVLISYNATGHSWCESYLTPEGGVEGQYNRNSMSSNNATWHNVFYNKDSQFTNGVVFENTPGKTYNIRVIGYVGGGWASVVSSFTYTVPTTPTLSVASDYLANTLTYTLVNNGKGGAIYRYDSEAKAKIGGSDYDKKIDITYGGDPVVDTVDAAGTYYYTIKQEGISDTIQLITNPVSNGLVANTPTFNYTVEEIDNGFILTGTKNDAGFADGTGRNWTTAKMIDMVFATAANAQSCLIPSVADSSTWYSFVKSLDGVTDSNGAIAIGAGLTFTFDGTELFDFDDANAIKSTSLKRGGTYRLHLTSHLNDGTPDGKWANEDFTFVIPELTVVSATNTAPPKSWITDMEVIGEGLVKVTVDDLIENTAWAEIAIFTEEKEITANSVIYQSKLDRNNNYSLWSGQKYGNIGSGTTGDFVFDFVDGTTYYVYITSCNGSAWTPCTVPYVFTYEAPAPTEETWITDATVVGDGLVNLTFGNLGDDTSWSEIAIFTEDKGALDFNTIYASALSRPGNHSVWGGHKEGTVGSNGQFAFELVDGTTYYVYVVRNVGGVWDDDHLIKPFSFTYNAPQATPEPTPVPTPTVIPDDGDNGTADISVVLYAITALAGAGAVVAIKRKKA